MKLNKSEKAIQTDIIKALKKIDGCVVFAHTASPYSPTGHSDLYGSAGGVAFWGEVKRPGEEATPIQKAFLEMVREGSHFFNTFVWDNVVQAVKDIKELRDQSEL